MNELDALEDWAGPLLQRLEPTARTKLARTIAQQLRRSQQQRIAAQRNADGTPFAPRKPRLRAKRGRVRAKAKMFGKLRTATHLKARGAAAGATVGFTGRVARIAKVHQHGSKDRAQRGAPMVKYARRTLLGFTDQELETIRNTLLDHLSM